MIKYFKFYLSFIVVLTISTTNSMLLFAQENNSDEIKEENVCENNDELEFSNLYVSLYDSSKLFNILFFLVLLSLLELKSKLNPKFKA